MKTKINFEKATVLLAVSPPLRIIHRPSGRSQLQGLEPLNHLILGEESFVLQLLYNNLYAELCRGFVTGFTETPLCVSVCVEVIFLLPEVFFPLLAEKYE